jgi:hypothetical protein
VPGVALAFACLVLDRWAARRPSVSRDVVLGLAIAAATYVRTLNVLILPALLLARVLARRARGERGEWLASARERLLAVAIVPLLALAPWSARNSSAPHASAADQTLLASYWTGMFHVDAGDPSSPQLPISRLLNRVPVRGGELVAILGTDLRTSDPNEASTWSLLLGGAILALAAWSAVKRRETADLFFCATLIVLAVYFAFEDRIALPTWMLALALAAERTIELALRVTRRASRNVIAAAIAILALACARPRDEWERIERNDRAWREVASGFASALPADCRLASMCGWHYEAFLDRHVYNLGFAWRRARGASGTKEELDRRAIEGVKDVLARRQIDAVIVAPFDLTVRPLLPLLAARCRAQEVAGGGVIYWIHPR